jgi:ATP-binding cassette subfamily F protein uup
MEGRILEAERRLEDCRQAATDRGVATDHKELSERLALLAAVQAEVDSLYARWAELEAKVTA